MPCGGTFRARRPIPAIWQAAGIAEAHRQDGDARDIVEGRAVDAHPEAQALTRSVVPGDAGFVDLGAGGLPDDQQTRGAGNAEDRAGA